MLSGSQVMTFVATVDAERARAFYEKTLGLSFAADDGFALVFRLAGDIMLRIAKVKEFSPQPFTVLGWQVDDIVARIGELTGRGVTFERFSDQQDDLGIWTFPGGTRVAWFKDPNGNMLSLTQFAG